MKPFEPLRIRVAIDPANDPLLQFFSENGLDAGSVSKNRLYEDAPASERLLCVAIDQNDLLPMVDRLKATLAGHPDLLARATRVALIGLTLDMVLMVFLGIEAAEYHEPASPAGHFPPLQ